MANEEQRKILRQGSEVWNSWRSGKPDVMPDLTGANLFEANLYGANLNEANFNGADLHEANLCRADLHVADLSMADLSEANLSHAKLRNAKFGLPLARRGFARRGPPWGRSPSERSWW